MRRRDTGSCRRAFKALSEGWGKDIVWKLREVAAAIIEDALVRIVPLR
jgi:hypothetical protein